MFMDPFENVPQVPLTLEGASVLHQMMRVRRPAWRGLAANERDRMLAEAGEDTFKPRWLGLRVIIGECNEIRRAQAGALVPRGRETGSPFVHVAKFPVAIAKRVYHVAGIVT